MGVVFSPNLVLAEDAGITLDSPLLLWQNRVTVDNPLEASAGAAFGFPVTELINPATDLIWISGASVTQYLTHTTGSAEPYDCVGVARHNFGSLGKSVSVEGDTGSGWVALTTPFVPADDSPLMFRFTPGSFTGLRIKITDNIGGVPESAAVFFGRSLPLQRRIYVGHTPITYGRNVMSYVGRAVAGAFLGEITTAEFLESNIEIQNMTPTWYRERLDPFIKVCKRSGFFFAWRPQSYPLEIGYCWVTNSPKPTNQRPNGMMQIAISVSGIGAPPV